MEEACGADCSYRRRRYVGWVWWNSWHGVVWYGMAEYGVYMINQWFGDDVFVLPDA